MAFYLFSYSYSTNIFSTELLSQELIEKISILNTFFAVPFLFMSWWFLINIFFVLSGTPKSKIRTSISLIITLIFFIGALLILNIGESIFETFKYLFFIENIFVCVLISALILTLKNKVIKKKERFIIFIIVFIFGVLISTGVLFYHKNSIITLAFISFFFIAQTWIPLVFKIVFQPTKPAKEIESKFDFFCKKYKISKRESDIITEICMGLTNKEIAGRLFISVQTVKDHSSRIYLKTEVKNRTQLANLFRE